MAKIRTCETDLNRGDWLRCRASQAECEVVKGKAKAAGLGLSDFMRRALLSHPIRDHNDLALVASIRAVAAPLADLCADVRMAIDLGFPDDLKGIDERLTNINQVARDLLEAIARWCIDQRKST
ncbi:plasmid mobilization protein [Paramagnetospirillum magnetotacticum]|nr:hypothetical protein [Paramagnetospirillum magnetotacticum]